MSARRPSLAGRLLLAQVGPLAVLAIALAIGGALTAWQVVERTSDRLLAGSLTAIQAGVTTRDGRPFVLVEPWSLGLLDSPERDAVYYAVYEGRTLLTGYADLPASPADASATPHFAYGWMKDARVRIAQQSTRLPGVPTSVTVVVAQTLDSRQASVRELILSLIVVPVALVASAAVLIGPAIRWGLAPARRLALDVAAQSDAARPSFALISPDQVPRELIPFASPSTRLLERLRAAMGAWERFSADASHQLRTPLTVIMTNLALLRPIEGSEHERMLITDSREAAARLQALLTQLLALSRSEAAVLQGKTDLNRAVALAVSEVARAYPGVRFIERFSEGPLVIGANEALVGEMLVNLLSNAAGHGGGRVGVLVHGDETGAEITIWDHGPGVPEADLGRLFDRFHRGETATSGGAGLGLSIVQAIATALGARVSLTNRTPRSGLRASIRFPLQP